MENRNLTPQESMVVITQMIEATKQRIAAPDLRISIMWSILSIVTAAVVLATSLLLSTPSVNFIWLAIPVVGLPLCGAMRKKSDRQRRVTTAIDRINEGIWRTVTVVSLLLMVVCIVFQLMGHPEAWLAMLFFAFIVVGFGAAAQGVILKENSYVFGGVFSILAGFVVVAMTICRMTLSVVWMVPFYVLCCLLIFVVPAFVIRRKLNGKQS